MNGKSVELEESKLETIPDAMEHENDDYEMKNALTKYFNNKRVTTDMDKMNILSRIMSDTENEEELTDSGLEHNKQLATDEVMSDEVMAFGSC